MTLFTQMENKMPDITSMDTKREKGKEKKGESYKVKATWGEKRHELFIKICLEQMKLGNRPNHTLNKEGYRNLEKRFFKETRLQYNKSQFKNHWDSTRRDWKAWCALRKSNEVVWDEKKNTYSQTCEWWADFALKNPGGAKFAEQALTHVEELDLLFGEGEAEAVFVPGLGNILEENDSGSPSEGMVGGENKTSIAFEDRETVSTPTGSTNVPPSPICSAGYSSTPIGLQRAEDVTKAHPLRCREPHQPCAPRPEKRSKTTTGSPILESSLKQMCDLLSERTKRLAGVSDDSNPISSAIDLLNAVNGIERNSDEWLFTASLLRDQSTRHLFIALGNPESRFAWIKREYRLSLQ